MLSRRISRPMATVMTAAALAVVGAAPAMAGPIDRPLLDTNQVDFGNSWANQAPTSGGTLDWDTGNGNTCLDGNIYLKNANNVTAQVWLEIYPSAVARGESDRHHEERQEDGDQQRAEHVRGQRAVPEHLRHARARRRGRRSRQHRRRAAADRHGIRERVVRRRFASPPPRGGLAVV